MKRTLIVGIAVVVVMALLVVTASVASAQGGGNDRRGQGGGHANSGGQMSGGLGYNLPPASSVPLTAAQIELITDGLLDEYNAYNAYQLLINQFGAVRPFTNIQRAEAQHIAAWKVIFTRYGIAIPEQPALGQPASYQAVTDACKVAAELEQANIGLYDDMLAAFTAYPDITRVITELRSASLNSHLPALTTCAAR